MAAAEASLKGGRIAEAEERYRDALAQGWMLLGTLQRLDARFAEAESSFRMAVASGSPVAAEALALLLIQKGAPTEAVTVLKGLAAKETKKTDMRRLLAQALLASNQADRAVSTLEEAHAADPGSLEVSFALADELPRPQGRGSRRPSLRPDPRGAASPADARPDRRRLPPGRRARSRGSRAAGGLEGGPQGEARPLRAGHGHPRPEGEDRDRRRDCRVPGRARPVSRRSAREPGARGRPGRRATPGRGGAGAGRRRPFRSSIRARVLLSRPRAGGRRPGGGRGRVAAAGARALERAGRQRARLARHSHPARAGLASDGPGRCRRRALRGGGAPVRSGGGCGAGPARALHGRHRGPATFERPRSRHRVDATRGSARGRPAGADAAGQDRPHARLSEPGRDRGAGPALRRGGGVDRERLRPRPRFPAGPVLPRHRLLQRAGVRQGYGAADAGHRDPARRSRAHADARAGLAQHRRLRQGGRPPPGRSRSREGRVTGVRLRPRPREERSRRGGAARVLPSACARTASRPS